jgi:hypothetical protein
MVWQCSTLLKGGIEMRRFLLPILACAVLATGCALLKTTKTERPAVIKTEALVQSWANAFAKNYELTKALPVAKSQSNSATDNGQPISAYTESLGDHGASLDRLDSWGTQLKCLIDDSGRAFVILSCGSDRVLDTNLAAALRDGVCYKDDVVAYGTVGATTAVKLLKGVSIPTPVLTLPSSTK